MLHKCLKRLKASLQAKMAELHSLKRRTRSMRRKTHTTEETTVKSKNIQRRRAQTRPARTVVEPRITYLDLPREIRHRILKLALKTDVFHKCRRHAQPLSFTQRPGTSDRCHEPPRCHSSPTQSLVAWPGVQGRGLAAAKASGKLSVTAASAGKLC